MDCILSGCMSSGCINNPMDNEFTNEMQKIIDEHILLIPAQYQVEKVRIVDEMRGASPQPYRDLLFVDYPTKNGPKVNALARKNVTSDQVKHQIAHQVYERLEPTIEGKTADLNPLARWITLHVIENAIKVAVYRAVDTVVLDDRNTSTTTTSSTQ